MKKLFSILAVGLMALGAFSLTGCGGGGGNNGADERSVMTLRQFRSCAKYLEVNLASSGKCVQTSFRSDLSDEVVMCDGNIIFGNAVIPALLTYTVLQADLDPNTGLPLRATLNVAPGDIESTYKAEYYAFAYGMFGVNNADRYVWYTVGGITVNIDYTNFSASASHQYYPYGDTNQPLVTIPATGSVRAFNQ